MTATPLGWALVNNADSLGTVFNGLAIGAAAVTAAIDNTEATVGSAAYEEAELYLLMSAAITTAGTPFINAVALPSYDGGTTYEQSFVSGTTLYPLDNQSTKPLLTAVAYSLIQVRLFIPPTLFKIAVLNNSGVAFAATVTANLYRMRQQAG